MGRKSLDWARRRTLPRRSDEEESVARRRRGLQAFCGGAMREAVLVIEGDDLGRLVSSAAYTLHPVKERPEQAGHTWAVVVDVTLTAP